jgi:hypothetical protein
MSETLHHDGSTKFNIEEFRTAGIVRNPNNSRAMLKSDEYQRLLGGYGISARQINSRVSVDDYKSNEFQDYFKEYDGANGHLWIVEGGDGSHSNFGSLLPESEIIFDPAGNINDGSHMLFGNYSFNRPSSIIKRSRIKTLNPLEIKIKDLSSGKTNSETALWYFGIGLSGLSSNKHNSPDYRNVRDNKPRPISLLKDAHSIVESVAKIDWLRIDEADKKTWRRELLFANGSRMAKLFHFRGIDILEPGARRVEYYGSGMTALIATIGKTALFKAHSDMLIDQLQDEHRFTVFPHNAPKKLDSDKKKSKLKPWEDEVSFILSQDFFSQRDGETITHNGATEFIVKLSTTPIRVVTTRSDAPNGSRYF